MAADGDVLGLGAGGGFRLCSLFSASTFRRKLLESLVCGGQRVAFSSSPPPEPQRPQRSDHQLAALLQAEASGRAAEREAERKTRWLEELRTATSKLQLPGGDSRREAAAEVRRLAKDNAEARGTLAMLGAIPPLAGMIDSGDAGLQIESLYALLNLGIGNDPNKAAIVEVGAVDKMLNLIESGHASPPLAEAIVANFLGLSALDSNKAVIGSSSAAIVFLIRTFRNADSKSQCRLDALRSLFSLSISPLNVSRLIESELVPCLIAAIGDMDVTEKVLSILANLVGLPEGRRAVSATPEAIAILVDVLGWFDSAECQEKAAYILMIMAHKSYADRAAMVEAGIVSSLLELTLIGTPLAQKRASRILEIFRDDKGKQISEGFRDYANGTGCSVAPPFSAPLCADAGSGEAEESGISEERKAVRGLVQLSLQNNMRRIARRANLPQDVAPPPSSDRFPATTVGASAWASCRSLPL